MCVGGIFIIILVIIITGKSLVSNGSQSMWVNVQCRQFPASKWIYWNV